MLQSRTAAYMSPGGCWGVGWGGEAPARSHLVIEGCNGYVTARCHMMLCEYEALCRRQESSLTARCSVTACQYAACCPPPTTPSPTPTPPGPVSHSPCCRHTFFFFFFYLRCTYTRSFDLIIRQVSKRAFFSHPSGLCFALSALRLRCFALKRFFTRSFR